MALLLGGCQAGGSIWKETISLEPKDKTVSEETLDPETDIDGQVESEQVDGAVDFLEEVVLGEIRRQT